MRLFGKNILTSQAIFAINTKNRIITLEFKALKIRKIYRYLVLILILGLSSQMAFATEAADSTALAGKASWFSRIETWYMDNMSYPAITVLMAAESSIFPVPSELVVPPAVYVAMDPKSDMSIALILLFSTIGALLGATANYFILGKWLGRSVMYKFADSRLGHMLMMSSEKLQKTEVFFNKHGKISTFIGRFIPVVRHFISIPAGFAKMNYFWFALYTFIGAGLWNCVLAWLGYIAHGQQELIERYSHYIGYSLLALLGLFILYLVFKNIKKRRAAAK